MLFHSVKLSNYKSIGDNELSEIIIEPRITPIIGKNESGKSNVLSGLSKILFTRKMDSAFNKEDLNRNATENDGEIKYRIVLKATTDELRLEDLKKDTVIEITATSYKATGGIVDYYNKDIYSMITDLCNALEGNPFQLRDQELQDFRIYVNALKKTDELNIQLMDAALRFFNSKKSNIVKEQKEEISWKLEEATKKWGELLALLPSVFYRNADKVLKSQYKSEDIKKELDSPQSYPNSLLSDFVRLIQISKDDFILAAQAGISGQKTSIRKKIQRNIDEYINIPFSEFYDAESIFLSVDFDSNIVYFSVQSNDGQSLLLSERSNGLRWYLNTFIDAKAHDTADKNVVYLLDEPGTSLHINAQRELLKLFNHLSDKGNQVVYTTHSPYMLDLESDGIHRIRAVVKNTTGDTSVYKTAYDSRIAPDSQQDTLAPIISALGMNLSDTFGPAMDKVNIVTEGMSDYIYLCTMAKLLDVDMTKLAIIPSVGATNCVNICSILQGWGCKYIALFDYDKAGVETGGEHMRRDMFLELNKNYCYVNDISSDDIENQTYKKSPYMIEDLILRSEIKRFCNEFSYADANKVLTAKLMSNAILAGDFAINDQTKLNFRALFDRLLSCTNSK